MWTPLLFLHSQLQGWNIVQNFMIYNIILLGHILLFKYLNIELINYLIHQ